MKVYEYLLDAAREEPDKACLEFMGKAIPYAYLADQAGAVAAGLRGLGIEPGDSVGLMLPNIPQFVSALYGALMNGNIVVPLNVLLKPQEIRYQVEDSNMRLIFVFGMFLPQVEAAIAEMDDPPKVVTIGGEVKGHMAFDEIAATEERIEPHPTEPHDPVMTIYTSGTTGKPKGAQITNDNIVSNNIMTEAIFVPEEGDRFLCVLPLFHVYALNGVLNSSIRNRTTLVLHTQFNVDQAIESLANDNITVFAGVPTMFFYILKHPEAKNLKFPKLRHCFSGGAAMPVEVMKQFEKMFDVEIFEGFGLTETTVSVCCNRPDMPRKPGSIGLPYERVEMKIVDDDGNEVEHTEVGEIIVKAPNVMKGYLNNPEATAEAIRDGWFYTGDLGHRDEEGYFFIVDRKKDMIIKGGYNIYPREIEEVIYQLEQVAEAAVLGVFDEAKGEVVRAAVALKPGQILTEETLRGHIESSLAKYKHPQEYLFLPELPKGPTGKILKREIKKNWDQWNKDRVKASTAGKEG